MSSQKIAIVVVSLSIGAVLVSEYILKRNAAVPEPAAMPATQTLPPLSAWSAADRKAATDLAEEICRAINAKDTAALLKVQDIDGLIERGLEGLNMSPQSLSKLMRGTSDRITRRPGGLFADFLGGRAKFLKLMDIRSQGSALIRLTTVNGSVNLLYVLPELRSGSARMMDSYQLGIGAFMSESIRDLAIPVMAAFNAGGSEERQLLAAMEALDRAKESGDNAAMLKAFRDFPVAVRNRANMRTRYLQCLGNQEDPKEYEEELRRIEQQEPASATTALRLMDLYALRQDWQAAAEAALKVDKALCGDAYFKSVAGAALASAGRMDEAEALFNEAEKMEPDLANAVWFRVHLDCARKDFAGAVKKLDRVKAAGLNTDFQKLAAVYPGLAALLNSDEYKAWNAAQ